jgi:hypothetical protein
MNRILELEKKHNAIIDTTAKLFENQTDLIMAEIQKFDQTSVSGPNVTHDIRWLRAGQEFDL